jgi:hypothetical protein
MEKLWTLVTALQKGKELQNKETWKNTNALMSIFLVFLAAIAEFVPNLGMTTSQESAIAYGLVTTIGVFNAYTTVATSKSVGVSIAK